MHVEAMDWLRLTTGLLRRPELVLELGSRDVNGSPRSLYPGLAGYVGVDRRDGPGVDVVADAATWRPPPWLRFNLCFSTEALEHAEQADLICQTAYESLHPGGVFLVTCAGVRREPHSMDGGPLWEGEFYRNVDPPMLRLWLEPFRVRMVQCGRGGQDLYAMAIK